jgi:hypothetical protein
MFENRVLRRLLGPKRDEVTGEWRKLHNEELNYLYSSSTSMRVMKSRMRWAEAYSAYGGKGVYRVLVRKPEEREHLVDPGVDEGRILRWLFRNWDVGLYTGLSCLRIGTDSGYL